MDRCAAGDGFAAVGRDVRRASLRVTKAMAFGTLALDRSETRRRRLLAVLAQGPPRWRAAMAWRSKFSEIDLSRRAYAPRSPQTGIGCGRAADAFGGFREISVHSSLPTAVRSASRASGWWPISLQMAPSAFVDANATAGYSLGQGKAYEHDIRWMRRPSWLPRWN